jgi:D-glycero-alpha-D-manno-heptose-7-phosphate kinase
MPGTRTPLRRVNSVAPIRICDNGGWSDTWFARHGRVFNIAVAPVVEVQIVVHQRSDALPRVLIHAENYNETYAVDYPPSGYGRHPLLEAALDYMRLPDRVSVEVGLYSEAPGGCSTGTSAAVSVALIAALDRLTPGTMAAHEIAAAAHRIETDLLKQQSGIQDQIASAYGGVNYIEMYDYPRATVSRVPVPEQTLWELEGRLALIYVGRAHSSSTTHEMVIQELQDAGPEAPRLDAIRSTAARARDALCASDFTAFGRAMAECTEAQRALHPDLIGPRHQNIIDIAREHGALGWKVNGAGGAGGSVTLLSGPDRSARRAMLRAVASANPEYRVIPVTLSPLGVRTWSDATLAE